MEVPKLSKFNASFYLARNRTLTGSSPISTHAQ